MTFPPPKIQRDLIMYDKGGCELLLQSRGKKSMAQLENAISFNFVFLA